jgi:putative zinc finger/helix-turn-helix YgiT family protein
MTSPFTGGEVRKQSTIQSLTYRSQSFQVHAHYYECVDTGETYTTEELDALNLLQLHNQYRERNHILFPEQIKALRERYGVSQRTMSTLMGFGINQYRSYEEGEIPSLSNAKLISLVRDARNFRELVLERKADLKERELADLLRRADELLVPQVETANDVLKTIWNPFDVPGEYTGYRVPNFEKFAQMVLFFYSQMAHLYTVRLNKLLFYADFGHFKRTGYSISGARYCAIPKGPVPDEYRTLNDLLVLHGYLEQVYTELNGEVFEAFQPSTSRSVNEAVFSHSELEMLQLAAKTFRFKKTAEIIEFSHGELGWIDNEANKSPISYQQYGFMLKAI